MFRTHFRLVFSSPRVQGPHHLGMKRRPCIYSHLSRHTVSATSSIPRPAGTRLAAATLSSFTTNLSRMQQSPTSYRSLSTLTPGLHLTYPSFSMARTGGTQQPNGRLNTKPHYHGPAQRVRTYSQSQSRRSSVYRTSLHSSSTSATLQFSWLLRSNIAPRRGMSLPGEVQKRHLFGIGEIIGVLANVRNDLCGRLIIAREFSSLLNSPQRRSAR